MRALRLGCFHTVDECVQNTLLTLYIEKYLTFFAKLTSTMNFETQLDSSNLGSKVKVLGGIT